MIEGAQRRTIAPKGNPTKGSTVRWWNVDIAGDGDWPVTIARRAVWNGSAWDTFREGEPGEWERVGRREKWISMFYGFATLEDARAEVFTRLYRRQRNAIAVLTETQLRINAVRAASNTRRRAYEEVN